MNGGAIGKEVTLTMYSAKETEPPESGYYLFFRCSRWNPRRPDYVAVLPYSARWHMWNAYDYDTAGRAAECAVPLEEYGRSFWAFIKDI